METQNEPAGALAQVVTDKKKKKKKKLTAKERAKEKLDKDCEKILEDPIKCNELFLSVGYWLKSKQKFLHKLFNQQCLQSLDHEMFKNQMKKIEGDEEPENPEENPLEINTLSTVDFRISHDDFKMVTTDLEIPCTNIQLHVLCKILDPTETGFIDFRGFTTEFLNLQIKRQHIDGIKFIKGTEPTRSAFTFKKELASGLNPPRTPHYIKLDLKLVTFANDKEFKGHIKDEIVCTNFKILSLIELIKEKNDIVSMKISIFHDTSKSKASYLEENKTLESYGFAGKTYADCIESSEKVVLFFDYMILANDDPILNCDFYFHNYKSTPKKN